MSTQRHDDTVEARAREWLESEPQRSRLSSMGQAYREDVDSLTAAFRAERARALEEAAAMMPAVIPDGHSESWWLLQRAARERGGRDG